MIRTNQSASYLAALLSGVLLWQAPSVEPRPGKTIQVELSNSTVPRYSIIEFSIQHDESEFTNVWEGPVVSVVLSSPSGIHYNVGGFYYSDNLWKARFAPRELGTWQWSLEWHDDEGTQNTAGTFDSTVETDIHAGPIRSYRQNPFRLIFDDGTLYPAIGLEDCLGLPKEDNGRLQFNFDGESRSESSNVDADIYLEAYSHAGFNLFRWTVDNCSFRLWSRIDPQGNSYLVKQGQAGDDLVAKLRSKQFRIFMTIFNRPPFPGGAKDEAKMAAVQHYVKYVVDRYGAAVDFWELMNESTADDAWYSAIANYIRTVDPYAHPISTSYPRPELPVIDINSPHWYEKESEFDSDVTAVRRIQQAKAAADKAIIFGEQGNSVQNWDDRSALRMRIRSWTAFFNEAILIFWNTSFARNYQAPTAANIYLGPQERYYISNLQSFANAVDPDVRMTKVSISPSGRLRAFALSSNHMLAAYIHNYKEHDQPTTSATLQATFPHDGLAFWYKPGTGHAFPAFKISAGVHKLQIPEFVTDIALIVKPSFAWTPPVDP